MNNVNELYNNLMALVSSSDISKFFYKDLNGPQGGIFRVFSYHYASYSDWLKPDAKECRGIVFEMKDEQPVRIACRPMEKFFNLNENPLTMNLNLDNIEYAQDKADGSLVSSYIDGTDVYLKSKTSFFSEQAMAANKLLNLPENEELKRLVYEGAKEGLTFNFEYVSPENRIVLPYQEERLILLNVRITGNSRDGEYVEYTDLVQNSVLQPFLVKAYMVENPTQWIQGVRDSEGIEGYVVRMKDGQFFKIKTNWYCALHHTKDSITNNGRLYASIVAGAGDDLRGMFSGDEYAIAKISAFEQSYINYLSESLTLCQNFYNEYRGRDRKDYALAGQKATFNQKHLFAVIMKMYAGTMDADKLLKSLEDVFLKYWELYVPKAYEKEISISEE